MINPNSSETPVAQEIFLQAQEAMLNMFKMGSAPSTQDTIGTVANRVVDSQKLAFDTMRSFASVWTDLAKRGFSPEAWQSVMEETTSLMSQSAAQFDPEKVLSFWREQNEQMMGANPWLAAQTQSPLWTELFGQEEAGFSSTPAFGLTREYQSKVSALFEDWLEHQKKEFEYRQMLVKAWQRAFEEMTTRMASMIQEGRTLDNPRAMMDIWVEVADRVFTDVFHTESFSLLQSEMLNASHRVRLGRQALTEEVLRANDMPTKSDLEEAHRMIYVLRKELRALKREVETLRRA